MPKSAFGLDIETPEADDPFGDAPEIADVAEAEAPVEEVVPDPEPDTTGGKDPLVPDKNEPAEPALDEEAPEEEIVAEEEPEEEEPAPATPYEGRYSSKYKTVEDFEEAHRNALDLGQRQAERARTAEQQLAQATAYLEAAARYISEQEAKANEAKSAEPNLEAIAAQSGIDVETLQLARQLAAQEAESKIAPLQAKLTEQEQMQQQMQLMAEQARIEAEAKAAITAFRAEHPDLDADTENEIVSVFNEFGLETTLAENYPLALELSQQPELRSVLRANPTYLDTDDGLALARRLAGVKTVAKPKSKPRDLTDARKKATVESGNLGAPPAGEEAPHDDWDDVLDVARGARATSVFGV